MANHSIYSSFLSAASHFPVPQDFECWKVHAMLDDAAVENEFRSAMDTSLTLKPDEPRAQRSMGISWARDDFPSCAHHQKNSQFFKKVKNNSETRFAPLLAISSSLVMVSSKSEHFCFVPSIERFGQMLSPMLKIN